MVKKSLVLTALLFLTSVSLFSQGFKVVVKADPLRYMVGDSIKIKFDVVRDKGVEFQFPFVRDSIKKLDFLTSLDTIKEESGSQLITKYCFVFQGFDSSRVTIPSITFPYTQTKGGEQKFFKSDSLTILVQTVAVDTTKEIKEIKKPVRIPYPWLETVLWSLLGVSIIILLIYLFKRYKAKKSLIPKKVVPPKSPYQIALEMLKEVESKELWQNGMVKEYYSEVTDIIRLYFEDSFRIPALESTTDEVLDLLVAKKECVELLHQTSLLLREADFVKFAKFIPNEKSCKNCIALAYEILEKAKLIEVFSSPDEAEDIVANIESPTLTAPVEEQGDKDTSTKENNS